MNTSLRALVLGVSATLGGIGISAGSDPNPSTGQSIALRSTAVSPDAPVIVLSVEPIIGPAPLVVSISGRAKDMCCSYYALNIFYGDGEECVFGPPHASGTTIHFDLLHVYAVPDTYTVRAWAFNNWGETTKELTVIVLDHVTPVYQSTWGRIKALYN